MAALHTASRGHGPRCPRREDIIVISLAELLRGSEETMLETCASKSPSAVHTCC